MPHEVPVLWLPQEDPTPMVLPAPTDLHSALLRNQKSPTGQMLRGLPEELRTPGQPRSARLEMPREEDAPFLPRRAPGRRHRASLGQQNIGPARLSTFSSFFKLQRCPETGQEAVGTG